MSIEIEKPALGGFFLACGGSGRAHASILRQGLPVSRTDLDQISNLEGGPKTNFAQAIAIIPHEIKNFHVFAFIEIVISKHAAISITMHLLDAEHLVTLSVDGQIQEVTARLQGIQVRLNLGDSLAVERLVGNEDDRPVEIERVGNTFFTQQTGILVVRNATGLARIPGTLEQVLGILIFPDVSVIEHQNILGVGELVEQSKQTDCGHGALDNLKAELLASQLVEHGGLVDFLLNTKAFAYTRGT